jgi:hypothetical protein
VTRHLLPEELTMTDPERDHFVQEMRGLHRRLRVWRLACLVLLWLLMLPVVLGGLLGVWWVPRLERERAEQIKLQVYMESVRATEEALQQADRQRAEEEARRRAQQGPAEHKD